MRACMHVRVNVCVCVCEYACMHVRMNVCVRVCTLCMIRSYCVSMCLCGEHDTAKFLIAHQTLWHIVYVYIYMFSGNGKFTQFDCVITSQLISAYTQCYNIPLGSWCLDCCLHQYSSWFGIAFNAMNSPRYSHLMCVATDVGLQW